jgi:predicted secreted hydrolase
VRLLAVAFGAIVLAATAASAPPRVHLPRDHFGHDAGIEWWYLTADVRGSNGHRYSVFFTTFKRGGFILPVSQVVDLSSGKVIAHSERAQLASIGSSKLNYSSPAVQLEYAPAKGWIMSAGAGRYTLHVVADPEKPYVLHGGGTGVIRQGPATSAYYSGTRMTTRGSFTDAGSGRRIGFTGEGWLDHQWGNFATVQRALRWDWFSCRFSDRTELMLYRFRDGHHTGTFVNSSGHGTSVGGFVLTPGTRSLDAAGRRWPLDWTIRVVSPPMTLSLRSIVRDQLVRGRLVPTFWEGASTARGTKRGTCFVEETR